ncbi:hypothetical protein BGX28_008730 [Mortierella sp. GBA30]|nr:hypothetical protein BGX28_008730 [Mortierella sp. GBA30]
MGKVALAHTHVPDQRKNDMHPPRQRLHRNHRSTTSRRHGSEDSRQQPNSSQQESAVPTARDCVTLSPEDKEALREDLGGMLEQSKNGSSFDAALTAAEESEAMKDFTKASEREGENPVDIKMDNKDLSKLTVSVSCISRQL